MRPLLFTDQIKTLHQDTYTLSRKKGTDWRKKYLAYQTKPGSAIYPMMIKAPNWWRKSSKINMKTHATRPKSRNFYNVIRKMFFITSNPYPICGGLT